FGGLMVTVQIDGKTSYTKISQMKTDLVLYIPDYELKTTDARSVLPASLQMDTATTASAVSNVMLAALLSEDYQLARYDGKRYIPTNITQQAAPGLYENQTSCEKVRRIRNSN